MLAHMLWKEFTREKPARQGWTLATMSLAFLATLGGAAYMVHSDFATNRLTQALTQKPNGWPISFRPAPNYSWYAETHTDPAPEAAGMMIMGAYRNDGLRLDFCVEFGRKPGPPPSALRVMGIEGATSSFSEAIKMGPIEGRLSRLTQNGEVVGIHAFGTDGKGLYVSVLGLPPSDTTVSETEDVTRYIAESIDYQ